MTLFTVLSTAVSTGFSTIVFGAHCVTSDPGWETDTAPAQMFEGQFLDCRGDRLRVRIVRLVCCQENKLIPLKLALYFSISCGSPDPTVSNLPVSRETGDRDWESGRHQDFAAP